jgi:hypothetical protein
MVPPVAEPFSGPKMLKKFLSIYKLEKKKKKKKQLK